MKSRFEVIEEIMEDVYPNQVVVASNGMVSRDLYAAKDRPLNLYLMGGMGSALSVGLGIALNYKYKVIVISGDGAAAMGAGSVLTLDNLCSNIKEVINLHLYLLENRVHATTGGQPCVQLGFYPNTTIIDISTDKGDSPRIPMGMKEIVERFKNDIINRR